MRLFEPPDTQTKYFSNCGWLSREPEEIDDCRKRGCLAALVTREGVMAAADHHRSIEASSSVAKAVAASRSLARAAMGLACRRPRRALSLARSRLPMVASTAGVVRCRPSAAASENANSALSTLSAKRSLTGCRQLSGP